MIPRAHLERIQLAVRASVAAGLSLALAQAFALEYPIYSFLAAVIVTDLSATQTSKLGWRRLVATLAGAACGATLCQVFAPGPWTIGLGVLVAMLICNLLRMQEAAKVGGYICGIVMLTYRDEAWSYAYFRLLETVLGIGVAWSISLVPKLIETDAPSARGS